MKYAILILVVLAATGIPVQVAANTRLEKAVHSAPLSTTIAFLVGALVLGALTATGWMGRGDLHGAASAPWWAWTGGIFSAFIVITSVLALPSAGAGAVIAVTVFGQLLAAIILDHFGWMGVPRIPVNAWRIVGAVLLLAGALLMQRK